MLHRLEDHRRAWQDLCNGPIDECVARLIPQVSGLVGGPNPPAESQLAQVADGLRQGIHDWANSHLVGNCLTWLRENGEWPRPEKDLEYVRTELAAALQHLPRFDLAPPVSIPVIPVSSWVIAAACGAALGMFLFAPLTLLVMGQREVGLFLGGVLGAAALPLVVGLLARAPSVRAALTYALTVSAAGSLIGGVWAYWKQRSTGWLRGSLGLIVGAVVVFLARPRLEWSARDAYLEQTRQNLRAFLRHIADLVLAWCWAHLSRQPPGLLPAGEVGAKLPLRVANSLQTLRFLFQAPNGTPQELRDAVEEFFQRFEDEGFEWKTVPDGTLFDMTMKDEFDTLGLIPPGQPVRTRRAALRHGDQLIQRGELRPL